MDWMHWPGWPYVTTAITACLFFWFGWDARRTRERTHAYLEYRASKYALVETLAGMSDPRKSPEITDELEAFARMISTAKLICGDLSEDEAHPDDR